MAITRLGAYGATITNAIGGDFTGKEIAVITAGRQERVIEGLIGPIIEGSLIEKSLIMLLLAINVFTTGQVLL